jgi:hypothetical protein
MARAYFNETQRFRQWWIYLVVLATIAAWGYAFVSSLRAEDADKATEDYILILTSLVPVLLIFLLLNLRLVTRIRNDGVYFQFKPLQFKEKHIKPDEISSFEIRKYKPLLEYGGWGIRIGVGKRGTAYNVYGNKGLQLYLGNGKKILIGTQNPGGIEKAMEAMMEGTEQ